MLHRVPPNSYFINYDDIDNYIFIINNVNIKL